VSGLAGAVRRFASHWPTLVVGAGVLFACPAWAAAAWFAASRLAYVLFVGASLRAEGRRGAGGGREASWTRFSARSSWLMDNDAVAFVVLCLATAGRFEFPMSWPASVTAGSALAVLGIGVKAWAAASLPPGSYHWRNFFLAPDRPTLSAAGPYRWMSSPMYTLGYAHAYGLAVALQSPAGLAAAALAQLSMLLLDLLVERPHLQRLHAEGPSGGSSGDPTGSPSKR
jgi:protein-S-isoprenylcysteine O-methyltransferase Ste14